MEHEQIELQTKKILTSNYQEKETNKHTLCMNVTQQGKQNHDLSGSLT